MNTEFDGVIVYNELDAQKYYFNYYPVAYSPFPNINNLNKYPTVDVVFIGSAKNRLEGIRSVYKKFSMAGFSCYFYVTGVSHKNRKNDGIIYGDTNLSFPEYIARELSSKCLFEMIQDGSTGRTYRMMEAIIYNKKLITNCPEIFSLKYYNSEFVHYYKDIEDISVAFLNGNNEVDFNYSGDFSPIRLLDYIEHNF